MMKFISEYELKLRSLPYPMQDNQVIYVESEFNTAVNEFIRENCFYIKRLFEQEGLEFIYIPATGQIVPS